MDQGVRTVLHQALRTKRCTECTECVSLLPTPSTRITGSGQGRTMLSTSCAAWRASDAHILWSAAEKMPRQSTTLMLRPAVGSSLPNGTVHLEIKSAFS
eukprot:9355380-Pyramimonas_sp.AAC.1